MDGKGVYGFDLFMRDNWLLMVVGRGGIVFFSGIIVGNLSLF